MYRALRLYLPPRRCERLLVDMRPAGLSLDHEAYAAAVRRYREAVLPARWRRAWVLSGPDSPDWDFFVQLAAGAGQHVAVFSDPAEALQWLSAGQP